MPLHHHQIVHLSGLKLNTQSIGCAATLSQRYLRRQETLVARNELLEHFLSTSKPNGPTVADAELRARCGQLPPSMLSVASLAHLLSAQAPPPARFLHVCKARCLLV